MGKIIFYTDKVDRPSIIHEYNEVVRAMMKNKAIILTTQLALLSSKILIHMGYTDAFIYVNGKMKKLNVDDGYSMFDTYDILIDYVHGEYEDDDCYENAKEE